MFRYPWPRFPLVLVMAIFFASHAFCATVQIVHGPLPAGQTSFVEIRLADPRDVAGVQARLRYNPRLLEPVDLKGTAEAGLETDGSVLPSPSLAVNYEPSRPPDSEGWRGVSFVLLGSGGTSTGGRLLRLPFRPVGASLASTLGALKWDAGWDAEGGSYLSLVSDSASGVAPTRFDDGTAPFWRVEDRPWRYPGDPLLDLGGPLKLLSPSGLPVWQVAADHQNPLQVKVDEARPGAFTYDIVDAKGQPVFGAGQFTGASFDEKGATPAASVTFVPPDQIPGPEGVARRLPLLLRVRFLPKGSDQAETHTYPFTLVMPPVALVHGLWSGADTWDGLLAGIGPREGLYGAGYTYEQVLVIDDAAGANAGPVVAGERLRKTVGEFQRMALERYGYAFARVDAVGHGTGGLALRDAATGHTAAGDFPGLTLPVRRLITLDTPHYGMELAPLLAYGVYAPSDSPEGEMAASSLYRALSAFGVSPDSPALAATFPDTGLTPPTPVPALSMVGIAGETARWIVPELVERDHALMESLGLKNWNGLASGLFGSDSDLATSRRHQTGHTTAFYTLPDTAYPDAPAHAKAPLLAHLTQSDPLSGFSADGYTPFSGLELSNFIFPPLTSSLLDQLASTITERNSPPGAEPAPFYRIVSPVTDAVFHPGDTIPVTLEGATLTTVVAALGTQVATADATPWSLQVTAPEDRLGTMRLTVAGYNAQGEASIQAVPITLQPAQPVVDLDLDPPGGSSLPVGGSLHARLWATTLDSRHYNVTSAASGATYDSDNPDVVSVDSDGKLFALKNGVAHVTARYGDLTRSMEVKAGTGEGERVAGDVNGDGKIGAQDATLALQIAVQLLSPTPDQRQAADVNGDGRVNIADATAILRKVVGL